jgi:hypothetical protein
MSLAEVVSPYVGIVTELDELLPSPDDGRQFHVVAAASDPEHTLGRRGGRPGQPGSAYGPDRARVVAAATGEAVERYSAAYVPDEELVVASARELGAVDPLRPVREATIPLDRVVVAEPTEALDHLLPRLGEGRLALVLRDGELIGAVTGGSVARWISAAR